MAVSEIDLSRLSWRNKIHKNPPSGQTKALGGSKSRPRISAPFAFRHLSSGAWQLPVPVQQLPRLCEPLEAQPVSFGPIEVSMPGSKAGFSSTTLPFLEVPTTRAPTMSRSLPDHLGPLSSCPLLHIEGHVPAPLSIQPGKAAEVSRSIAEEGDAQESPSSPRNRVRGKTALEMEAIKERVAHAMNEVEQLQKRIDEIMERQSLHALSRSSTTGSVSQLVPEVGELPPMPALPPAAPSFAERLNTTSLTAEKRKRAVSGMALAKDSETPAKALVTAEKVDVRPLAPPTPHILRPPLRKKKSFTRGIGWLFPDIRHNKEPKTDYASKARAAKRFDGFYQCKPLNERLSDASIDTGSPVETDGEYQTMATITEPFDRAAYGVKRAEEGVTNHDSKINLWKSYRVGVAI